jgi:hypothetical protein
MNSMLARRTNRAATNSSTPAKARLSASIVTSRPKCWTRRSTRHQGWSHGCLTSKSAPLTSSFGSQSEYPQDLNVAALALVNDTLLLSANLRDFARIPKLRVADWLYE